MKKCFAYPSYYCRSDLSFQVGTLLGYDCTYSSVGLNSSVYRNCCEVVAKAEQGPMVELVDTYDLGSYAARCEGSSPFRPTNFLKMSFKKIWLVMLMCVDAIKVWGNVYEPPISKQLDLGSR